MNDPQITQWAAEYDAQFVIKKDEACCDRCQEVSKQAVMVFNDQDQALCKTCQDKLDADYETFEREEELDD